MNTERLAQIERLSRRAIECQVEASRDRDVLDLCAALREAWRERDEACALAVEVKNRWVRDGDTLREAREILAFIEARASAVLDYKPVWGELNGRSKARREACESIAAMARQSLGGERDA